MTTHTGGHLPPDAIPPLPDEDTCSVTLPVVQIPGRPNITMTINFPGPLGAELATKLLQIITELETKTDQLLYGNATTTGKKLHGSVSE